ncbi:MAG: hypothetical protein K0Q60_2324 [Microvirga sp.]|jgi:hypothetical protein|nr:hypothetical protein [Microvirga sp.]
MKPAHAGFVFLSLLAGTPAYSHDFYMGLQRPDGGSCCNGKDCFPTTMCVQDGREGVKVKDQCRPIEWPKVLPMSSPDGQPHVCHSAGTEPIIWCLILPGAA